MLFRASRSQGGCCTIPSSVTTTSWGFRLCRANWDASRQQMSAPDKGGYWHQYLPLLLIKISRSSSSAKFASSPAIIVTLCSLLQFASVNAGTVSSGRGSIPPCLIMVTYSQDKAYDSGKSNLPSQNGLAFVYLPRLKARSRHKTRTSAVQLNCGASFRKVTRINAA